MTFIVVFVALLIERFFDWSHLRGWEWFYKLECSIKDKMPGVSPYAVLAAAIAPLLIVLFILQFIVSGILFGFPWLVFQLIVFIYCLGPRDLWTDAYGAINSFGEGDERTVDEVLRQNFFWISGDSSVSRHHQLMNLIISAAYNRVFGVAFWFCILGLPGAILYRLVTVSANGGDIVNQGQQTDLQVGSQVVLAVLDWLPVRLFTIMFALGGNFNSVLNVWRRYAMLGIEGNEALLTDCGTAAVLPDPANVPIDGSLERNAIGMLDRVFIIFLVVVLVLVYCI